MGFRYRLDVKRLHGRPDKVMPKNKIHLLGAPAARQAYRAATRYAARATLLIIFPRNPLLTCSISLLPASSPFDPTAVNNGKAFPLISESCSCRVIDVCRKPSTPKYC